MIAIEQLAQDIRLSPARRDDAWIADWIKWREVGQIDQATLYDIARKKSPRRAELVKENSDHDVRRVTKLAYRVDSEATRIGLLCSLHGVKIPVASCILAWIYPDRWGVIDQRAWRELFRRGIVGPPDNGVGLRVPHWVKYNGVLQQLRELTGQEPRQIDLWLFDADRAYQGAEIAGREIAVREE